jgi:hypothetical protein
MLSVGVLASLLIAKAFARKVLMDTSEMSAGATKAALIRIFGDGHHSLPAEGRV